MLIFHGVRKRLIKKCGISSTTACIRPTRVFWDMGKSKIFVPNQIKGLQDQGFNSKLDNYKGAKLFFAM